MEVVGHQAIGEQAHAASFAGLAQELDEGGEVAVLVKDGAAAIAPVEDMVAIAAQGSACGAWHRGDYQDVAEQKQAKSTTVLLCRKPSVRAIQHEV